MCIKLLFLLVAIAPSLVLHAMQRQGSFGSSSSLNRQDSFKSPGLPPLLSPKLDYTSPRAGSLETPTSDEFTLIAEYQSASDATTCAAVFTQPHQLGIIDAGNTTQFIDLTTPNTEPKVIANTHQTSHPEYIVAAHLTRNGIHAHGKKNGSITLAKLNQADSTRTYQLPNTTVERVVFSPYATRIAVTMLDQKPSSPKASDAPPSTSTHIFDVENDTLTQVTQQPCINVTPVAFTPDNQHLITQPRWIATQHSDACTTQIIQLPPHEMTTYNAPTRLDTITISNKGSLVAACARDQRHLIKLLHIPTLAPVADLETKKSNSNISCCAFSPNDQLLACGTTNNAIILWDITDPQNPTKIIRYNPLISNPFYEISTIKALTFAENGEQFASVDEADRIQVWQLDNQARELASCNS